MNNIPVILVGGEGKRLWPMSDKKTPKQFLKFNSSYSLFQKSLLRLKKLNLSKPIIVCNEKDKKTISKEIKDISLEANILVEPLSQNTAPAVTVAALKANLEDNLVIFPCDHLIGNESKFSKAIKLGLKNCKSENFIIFGVKPTYAHTGYGYIKTQKTNIEDKYIVEKFIEKPEKKKAEKFLSLESYFWNCGIFIGKSKLFLKEIKSNHPMILKSCQEAIRLGTQKNNIFLIDKGQYLKCSKISIDKAVMEKAKKLLMIKINTSWNDLGSWKSIWEISKKDKNNNYLSNNVITKYTTNSYLNIKSKKVVAIGIEDMFIIENNDSLLIINSKYLDEMKNIYKIIKNMK